MKKLLIMIAFTFTTNAFAEDAAAPAVTTTATEATVPAVAEAKQKGKKIEDRIANQRKRIQNKLSKGKIDESEAAKLNQNVDQVEAAHKEASADGKINKAERKDMVKNLRMNSEAIKLKRKKAAKKSKDAATAVIPSDTTPTEVKK